MSSSASDGEKELEVYSKSRIYGNSLGKVQRPITISWQNLNYHVDVDLGGMLKKKVIKKQILHDVSGMVNPGEFIAIMGPTGSGKTTLLNILGRRIKENVSGKILFNGRPPAKYLKRLIGYVMQDDVFHSSLTVRDILTLTAYLRLPSELSRKEKLQRVDDVISVLNLGKAANSIVGGGMMRGVSGGERKRLNIGNELLINPSLLLLDEPTSGLDSTTALMLTRTLKDLAVGQRTVITSIHQPSSQMFELFDKLLLMVDGHMIYFNKACDAVDYFSQLAYPCSPNWNPADYILAITCEEEMDASAVPVKQKLITAFNEGSRKRELVAAVESVETNVEDIKLPKYTSSWFTQFFLLMQRSFKLKKYFLFDKLSAFQHITIAIVIGLIFFQLPYEEEYIMPRVGALFFIPVYWFIQPLFKYVQTFPSEQPILARERASGAYHLSAYYLAKSFAEFPFDMFYPSVFVIAVYWLIGISNDPLRFFIFWAIILFDVVLGQSLGIFLSAWLMDISKCIAITATFFLSQMLLGGFYIDTTLLPVWLRWAQYVSVNKYLYDISLSLVFTDGETYEPKANNSQYTSDPITGQDILDNLNIDKELTPIWGFILVMFVIVSRLAGYIGLRYLHKPKN